MYKTIVLEKIRTEQNTAEQRKHSFKLQFNDRPGIATREIENYYDFLKESVIETWRIEKERKEKWRV